MSTELIKSILFVIVSIRIINEQAISTDGTNKRNMLFFKNTKIKYNIESEQNVIIGSSKPFFSNIETNITSIERSNSKAPIIAFV